MKEEIEAEWEKGRINNVVLDKCVSIKGTQSGRSISQCYLKQWASHLAIISIFAFLSMCVYVLNGPFAFNANERERSFLSIYWWRSWIYSCIGCPFDMKTKCKYLFVCLWHKFIFCSKIKPFLFHQRHHHRLRLHLHVLLFLAETCCNSYKCNMEKTTLSPLGHGTQAPIETEQWNIKTRRSSLLLLRFPILFIGIRMWTVDSSRTRAYCILSSVYNNGDGDMHILAVETMRTQT